MSQMAMPDEVAPVTLDLESTLTLTFALEQAGVPVISAVRAGVNFGRI